MYTLPKLRLPLFLTRLSIAYFMGVWALDRIVAPDHAEKVAAKFYSLGPLKFPEIPQLYLGVILLVIYAAFLLGIKKKLTYLLVLIVQGLGVLFIVPNIIFGLGGYTLIFVAALPAFMAMVLLYVLRDHDTLFSINK